MVDASPYDAAPPCGVTVPSANTSQYPFPPGVENPLTIECGHPFAAAPAGAATSETSEPVTVTAIVMSRQSRRRMVTILLQRTASEPTPVAGTADARRRRDRPATGAWVGGAASVRCRFR